MCFIFNTQNMEINYNQIEQKKDILFEYLFHTSESFSFTESSHIDLDIDSQHFIEALSPYLLGRVTDKQDWLPHIAKRKNEIMCVYKCCKKTKEVLLDKFDFWWNDRTGCYSDICFYRTQKPWFYCINHEMQAFVYAQKKDVAFFNANFIHYWGNSNDINEDSKRYILPNMIK